MKVRVNKKESILFALKVLFTPVVLFLILSCIVGSFSAETDDGTKMGFSL